MRIPALLLWTILSTSAASSATEPADEPVITENSAPPAPPRSDGEAYLLALLGVVVIGAFIGMRRRD